jgi:hypothetical protein
MVHLMHKREQAAEFAPRKPFAGKPVKVMPGQVGDESTFVFAEGHVDGEKAFKVCDLHRGIVHGFPSPQIVSRSSTLKAVAQLAENPRTDDQGADTVRLDPGAMR